MTKEIWKDVIGYEGLYQVSNLGRVKSLARKINSAIGTYTKKEQIINGSYTKQGYINVALYKDGKRKTRGVHRIVLSSFTKIPSNKHECNHKNGIKDDNRLENLEWVTASENQKHAYKIGLSKPRKGETNGSSKLTDKDVLEIRDLYLIGVPEYDTKGLANKYNISITQIAKIVKGEIWTHLDTNKKSKIDQIKEAVKKGLQSKLYGECHVNSKLTRKQVKEIKNTYLKGSKEFGAKPLARKYNVTPSTIKRIIDGVTWRHID